MPSQDGGHSPGTAWAGAVVPTDPLMVIQTTNTDAKINRT
jgi:hypothetical protein